MNNINKEDKQGLTKSVFMAYFILILHVLLIAAMGVLVIFFRGIITYMPWICIGGTALIATSAWLFYKKMKNGGGFIKQMIDTNDFKSRSFEISFFGGLAAVRIGKSPDPPLIGDGPSREIKQLEDPEAQSLRELTELVKLLENDLITLEEYKKFKSRILKMN